MKSRKHAEFSFPSSYVHDFFGLPGPSRIKFERGWSDLHSKMGEFRDEQAWMLTFEFCDADKETADCQLGVLYALPSVSKNELTKAIYTMLKSFRSHPNKGKRPSLPNFIRQMLRALWIMAEDMARKELRPKLLVEIAQRGMKIVGFPISKSKIYTECRSWRKEIGRKVRKEYVTASRDRRPSVIPSY